MAKLKNEDRTLDLSLRYREAPRRLVGRGCKVIGSGSAVPNLHISKTILEKLLKLQRNGFLFTLEFVIDEFFQLKVFTFRFACTQWSMLRRGCTFGTPICLKKNYNRWP
ncbi:hypothetical protein NE237_030139 [Protea cynaroides]|uniref:Uncharacterized protein n=1 Tax=Protea cynaroides TaxID=273540 RepID=A0A9Q0GWM1_9MAGN|nr:hypothetical protein NE237_030139 [Protea cynaroides]